MKLLWIMIHTYKTLPTRKRRAEIPPVQENGVNMLMNNNNFLPGSTPGNAAPDEHVRDKSDAPSSRERGECNNT